MGEPAEVEYEPLPLLEFIPALSPRLQAPTHLGRLANAFERAAFEPVAAFGTTPPQVGKTELEKHAVVRELLARPRKRIGFCSYSGRTANKRSREIRRLYKHAGGHIPKGSDLVADWRTGVDDGGFWAGGIEGGWTGEGLDWIIVDDPIKGRAEAESGVRREYLWDFYVNSLETRLNPGGSIFVVHTRWTPDDLGGRLISGHTHPLTGTPFEHIRLPALDAQERSLCEWRFSTETYLRKRARLSPYVWASLYMGQPFARGGRAFEDCRFYGGPGDRPLPVKLRRSLGLDAAYSAKTHADWSVLLELGFDDSHDPPDVYVLRVIRHQERAPTFAARVFQVQQERELRGVDACWYYAGVEKGIVDFMRELGMGIDARQAALDKFIRAQPFAAAWNAGRVFVPRQSEQHPWVDDFVAELAAFTGVDDLHDDQVDAGAAAYDAGEQPSWVVAMQRIRKEGGWVR